MLARVGVFLAVLWAGGLLWADDDPKPVPLYTNDDLNRVRPFRDQTGVTSPPAVSDPRTPEGPAETPRGHDEAYWRREAERLQDRLAPMAERASRLRSLMAERRERPGPRGRGEAQIRAWQEEVDRIQSRMRALEERLHDRARKEGALPGWLR